jgi:hypothetical protein
MTDNQTQPNTALIPGEHIERLEAEVERLRRLVEGLVEQLVDGPARSEHIVADAAIDDRVDDHLDVGTMCVGPDDAAAPEEHDGRDRRTALKLALGVAAGAAAAVAASTPAAANDPNDLTLGATKATALPTVGSFTGTQAVDGFLFRSGTGTYTPDSFYGTGALTGVATTGGPHDSGVVGVSQTRWGVRGQSLNESNPIGVLGIAPATGSGAAVAGNGGFAGVSGNGFRVGGSFYGPSAAILMQPGNEVPPAARTDQHIEGELESTGKFLSQLGELWYCVQRGTPGVWRKLAGPTTAGALHAIEPQRVYDSRRIGARFAPNSNRVVSVATSTAGIADIVPSGATAVTFNVTAADTTGPNFLSVVPGDAAAFTTSTVNFPGGFDVANASVVKLDAQRQVRIFCGDQAGSTHAIVDITGYYL